MADGQIQVLVVEDDADTALFVRTVLERRAGMSVTVLTDALAALAHATTRPVDLVITDIQLPGMSGLELLRELRRAAPGVPVIVMTAFASVDYAVDALHQQADDFLVKPVSAADLTDRATRIAERGRARREADRGAVVLAVGAHPDDVEIGIGATLASHRDAGDTVVVLTMSCGAVGGDTDDRRHEALAAAGVVGARLFLLDFVDTQLEAAPDLIPAVERTVEQVRPTVVYTHSVHDRHQDHRAVHRAVQVATRQVPTLGCFQSPSATVDFRPTRFVTVDGFLDTKLEMLAAFSSQSHRAYMDADTVRATARYWARFGTGTYVEPLEMVRAAGRVASAASRETAGDRSGAREDGSDERSGQETRTDR
ncbi:response regulator [Cellulomonas palmilytica]|uniref:response regulator n=1 Tax=Cellulomonas palmilytica TaxID=2608402 RepID=UPI001F2A4DC7|nr:response regulator [Cellulomonas palmilytica]UJP39984.1 response regulator [Cellulomonas palmilytica]